MRVRGLRLGSTPITIAALAAKLEKSAAKMYSIAEALRASSVAAYRVKEAAARAGAEVLEKAAKGKASSPKSDAIEAIIIAAFKEDEDSDASVDNSKDKFKTQFIRVVKVAADILGEEAAAAALIAIEAVFCATKGKMFSAAEISAVASVIRGVKAAPGVFEEATRAAAVAGGIARGDAAITFSKDVVIIEYELQGHGISKEDAQVISGIFANIYHIHDDSIAAARAALARI